MTKAEVIKEEKLYEVTCIECGKVEWVEEDDLMTCGCYNDLLDD